MTNITFICQTSPITKPKEKKRGGHGILYPPRLKKWWNTFPMSPTKLRPWLWSCLSGGYLPVCVV